MALDFNKISAMHARRAVSGLLAIALAVALAPAPAFADIRGDDTIGYRSVSEAGLTAADAPSISAAYAYVADSSGNVYFQRDAECETNIASITKVMTAAVALEVADPDYMVTVSPAAASIGESTAELRAGDALTLKDAIIGLMVPSGNDAATAIAESVGKLLLDNAEGDGGDAAYDAFVAKMNSTAEEIGCTNTLFTNPHGLDIDGFSAEMHSTAKDVATFSAYAMENELFREIAAGGDATITVIRDGEEVGIDLASTDLLIGNYEGACGIKTGFTDAAGSCFAGACHRDDRYVYAIVLGSPDNDQRFTDARTLFDWVYDSERELQVVNSNEIATLELGGDSSEVGVIAHVAHDDWLDKTFAVTLANQQAAVTVSSIFGNVSQKVVLDRTDGEIHAGDVVGRLELYQHNELIGEEDIISCEDVDVPGLIDSIVIALQRLIGDAGNGEARTTICNELPVLVQKA